VAKAIPAISIGAVIKIDLISGLPQLVRGCRSSRSNEKGARRAASAPPTGKNAQASRAGRLGRPGFAISELWAHIATMAKSGAEIRFEARPMKAGHNWMIVVTFPDRPEMHVNDFPTEADARNWITNDSQEWLKKLGYGYE
jgi:hypothetical protein